MIEFFCSDDTSNKFGECVKILEGHTDGVECRNLSFDGKQLVSSSFDEPTRIWRVDAENERYGECVSYVVDQDIVDDDDDLCIHSGVSSLIEQLSSNIDLSILFDAHDEQIDDMCFSPDGKRLASGANGLIKIWCIDRSDDNYKECLAVYDRIHADSISFSPCGNYLVSSNIDDNGEILSSFTMWDAKIGSNARYPIRTFEGHMKSINSVKFSPCGKFLASCSDDRTMRIWCADLDDRNFGHCINYTFFPDNQGCKTLDYSPCGKYIVCGFNNGDVIVKDVESDRHFNLTNQRESEESQQELQLYVRWMRCVKYSPCGKIAAITTDDRMIKLLCFDVGSDNFGKCIKVLKGHTDSIECCNFSPDGKQLVSSSDDGFMRIWCIDSEDERYGDCISYTANVMTDQGSNWCVNSCVFSPCGRLVTNCSYNESTIFAYKGKVSLIDVDSFTVV